MKASIVNVHGDNFGDFLNASAARHFVTHHLAAEVSSVVPAGGAGRWRDLPNVGPICDEHGSPGGIYDPRDIARHILRLPHRNCGYREDWSALTFCLRESDYIVSAPCGANVGPYRDSAFLAPLIVGRKGGRKVAILGGTVHASGSMKYDILSQVALRGVHLSVRDSQSIQFLQGIRRASLGPVDVSFLTAGQIGASGVNKTEFNQRDTLCVLVGDALSWHPDAGTLEGHRIADSIAFQMLKDAISVARQHRLRVILLTHSPLPSERLRLEALRSAVHFAKIVEVVAPSNVEKYVAVIARSRLVFSLRYHGIVSALANAVPAVAVAYEAKSESLMEHADLSYLTMTTHKYSSAKARSKLTRALGLTNIELEPFVKSYTRDIEDMQEELAASLRGGNSRLTGHSQWRWGP